MKSYKLIVLSKNKRSLVNFFWFIKNNFIFSSNSFKKYSNSKIRVKKFTVLKSPHVNKNAQDQFEIRYFFQKLSVYLPENFKYLVFLKQLTTTFPDILLKIKISLNKKSENNLKLKFFTPNNFKINKKYYYNKKNVIRNKKNYSYQNMTEFKYFIKIFDSYGELHNCNS
nr:ribosomal protein S10 [Schizostauron trachyderma]